jgi:hypothetical protein
MNGPLAADDADPPRSDVSFSFLEGEQGAEKNIWT